MSERRAGSCLGRGTAQCRDTGIADSCSQATVRRTIVRRQSRNDYSQCLLFMRPVSQLTQQCIARNRSRKITRKRTKRNNSSAVGEMSDRLATIDKARKVCMVEAAVPLSVGELGPCLTQCRLGRGLPPYQVHLDPSSRLATIHRRYTDRQTDRTTAP